MSNHPAAVVQPTDIKDDIADMESDVVDAVSDASEDESDLTSKTKTRSRGPPATRGRRRMIFPERKAAGRPLPLVEGGDKKNSHKPGKKPGLKQQTMFQYAITEQHEIDDDRLNGKESAQLCAHTDATQCVHGDPHQSGSEIHESGQFRLYYNNVNGLSCRQSSTDVDDFVHTISDKECAVVAITEPNRNFAIESTVMSYANVMRQASSYHKFAVSSMPDQGNNEYLPGGTAISVRNKWATRYVGKGQDRLGRWSYLTLAGKGTTKITFIVAYRICAGGTGGETTSRRVRAQQMWHYADTGHPTTDPRKQFITDAIVLVEKLKSQGHSIVLSMDANEDNDTSTSGVARFLRSTALVDVHAARLDRETLPATYQRGSKKIDFCFLSPCLLEAVTACSILALHDGYLSDHRALVVDFNPYRLFGEHTSEIQQHKNRRLTSTDPRGVHTYTHSMMSHFERHNIMERFQALMLASANNEWTDECTVTYDNLCATLNRARSNSEDQLPIKASGRLDWSPKFNKARLLVHYWKLRLREKTGPAKHNKRITELESMISLSSDEKAPMVQHKIESSLRHAHSKYRLEQQASRESREEHLTEMASLAAELQDTTQAVARKAIAFRERRRRQFQALSHAMGTAKASGLDRIEVKNEYAVLREGEETPRIPLVVKEDIEKVLVEHTMRRFRQPYRDGTPFSSKERLSRIGRNCEGPDAEKLLEGSYDFQLENLSPQAINWLNRLKRKPFFRTTPMIDTNISVEEWISGWGKMRESTASSPTGHFGHYKTAAVVAKLPEEHEDHFPALAIVYAGLVSLPLKHGFAPQEWSQCVDSVLEKIPGCPIIEKLRVVMLFDAQFNFALKLVFGKRMICHAEKNSSFGPEHHGSRPGRKVQDALLEKKMLYDVTRLTRTSLITVDNDAKSCYDRIIKGLALISCMAVGLPASAAAMHNTVHDSMEHTIRTRHGNLRTYSGLDDGGSEGVGQGSGAAGAIWLIYSNTLIETLHDYSTGSNILSPTNRLLRVCLIATFFVDDGTPGINDALEDSPIPLENLVQKATDMSQAWEKLLFASGGALEFSKCFAYIVYWDHSTGTPRLLQPSEIHGCQQDKKTDAYKGPIRLTYGNETTQNDIATVSPWTGRRTLGVRIAPAGNWTDEFKYRMTQSHLLSLRLAAAPMTKDTAVLGYKTVVTPRIEFPLAITEFTQQQCDQILRPILTVMLPKMGYNRNMPREVVYGPVEMGGLGVNDLFVQQGIHAVQMMVGHLRDPSSRTASLMRIALQWCQVQAGTAICLLSDPSTPIEYVEHCWIMSLRSFLETYSLRIDITGVDPPVLFCEHDEFLMDALRVRGHFSAKELQRLNACRMALRVQRLSEIANASGTRIRTEILNGKQQHDDPYFKSTARWPRQGPPSKSDWSFWSSSLRRVFGADGTSRHLRTNLGAWFCDKLDLSEWPILASPSDGSAFCREPDGTYILFQKHTTGRSSRRSQVQETDRAIIALPYDAIPAMMDGAYRNQSRQIHMRTAFLPDTTDNTYKSFEMFVQAQPAHLSALLAECDLSETTAARFAAALQSSTRLSTGSDGGLLASLGTFGFVWGDPLQPQEAMLVNGKGQVPGASEHQSSTRAELCAILATLTYARLNIEYTSPEIQDSFYIQLVCDSQTSLSRFGKDWEPPGTSWRCRSHYDLESAITWCTDRLSFPIEWTWVRGHASRRKESYDFTWPEILNEAADDLATIARQTISAPVEPTHWPEQQISVVGNHGRLLCHVKRGLKYCCLAGDLLSYWKTRYSWDDSDIAILDHTASKRVVKSLTAASLRRFQKLRCGWTPVNRKLAREDPDRSPECAECRPALEETTDHIMQCPSQGRRKILAEYMQPMEKTFRSWKTSVHIISAMTVGFTAWCRQQPIPSVDTLLLPESAVGRLVKRAYIEQSHIGWGNFIRGFWSVSWRQAQERQFRFYERSITLTKQDEDDIWAGKAQAWFFGLFERLWEARNLVQHGADFEAARKIRLATCRKAIQRLYKQGETLPAHEQFPFDQQTIDALQSQPVGTQETWVIKTTSFIRNANRRIRLRKKQKDQDQDGRTQRSLTEYYQRLPTRDG